MKTNFLFKFTIVLFLGLLFGCASDDGLKLGFNGFPDAVTTLKGWELNETNTGLKGDYSKLTDIVVSDVGVLSSGNLLVNKNDITISDKQIPYTVIITGTGVVFERCRFQPTSCVVGMPIISSEETRAIFRDCEMDFDGIPIASAYLSICIVLRGEIYRCNIYGGATGITIHNINSAEASVAEGNYIHGLRYQAPAHVDGLTIRRCDGLGGMVIRNNYILVETEVATGPLFIQALQGHIDNVLIEGNFMQGTGNCLALEYNANGYGENMNAIDNRFDAWSIGNGGPYYGYHTGGSGWAIWRDIYAYDAKAVDCKGAPISEL